MKSGTCSTFFPKKSRVIWECILNKEEDTYWVGIQTFNIEPVWNSEYRNENFLYYWICSVSAWNIYIYIYVKVLSEFLSDICSFFVLIIEIDFRVKKC